MPINRLLAGNAFSPEQTRELIDAYEAVLAALYLTDRADPICELIAKHVVECAEGDFDRASIRDRVLAKLMT